MYPVLIVGVGGAGGKTVRALRESLMRKLRRAGWTKDSLPEGWQLLWIDSVSVQSADGFASPLLPVNQYLGLVPPGVGYNDLQARLAQAVQKDERQAALAGWVPETIPINVNCGAGQSRAIGRVVSASQLTRLRTALQGANDRLTGAAALSESQAVAELLGMARDHVPRAPLAIVVSSLGGGSGSGMFLDVVEALKSINPGFSSPKGVITVLYTPDVFSSLGGASTQIPSNTLAAVMEVMSGVFAEGLSAPSQSVFFGNGLTGRSHHGFGAKCNFLVGAGNESVSFRSQEHVYREVGEVIALLASEPRVREPFEHFYLGNVLLQSGQPMLVIDESRLTVDLDDAQSMPFSGLGMARVSVGTDRLAEYLTQLVSRDVTEMLLWPDFDPVLQDEAVGKTRDEIIDDRVTDCWEMFLRRSGLNQREPASDLTNALNDPQVEQRLELWSAAGIAEAGGCSLTPNDWMSYVTTYFDGGIAAVRAREATLRDDRARAWTAGIGGQIHDLVAESAMSTGLVVTARLLSSLTDEMAFVQSALIHEAATKRSQMLAMPERIQQVLDTGFSRPVDGDESLTRVAQIMRIGAQLLVDADGLEFTANLLKDLTDNMLRPLLMAVEFSRARLSEGANSDRLPDGLRNPWAAMPRYGSPVPSHLLPSPTERVLIEPATFEEEVEAIVRSCLSNAGQADEWRVMLRERAGLGRALETGDEIRASIFAASVEWVPDDAEATSGASAGVKAEFAFPRTVQDIVDVVERWLSDPEAAGGLGTFLRQGLLDFVDSGTPEQRLARQDALVAAFTEALARSEPFVKVNRSVVSVVHPNVSGGNSALVSTIPFASGHPVRGRMKAALAEAGFWTDHLSDRWFETDAVDSISVLTMTSRAMMPMVFDNLMRPIAESWERTSDHASSRNAFWWQRRSRPLVEFIPVGQARLGEMLRGWFLAGLLGQRTIEEERGSGWRAGVWSPEAKGTVSFPFPLLASHSTSRADLPAVIMESLAVALVEVNTAGNLDPLRAYHRLMDLGSEHGMHSHLASWIRSGSQVDPGAPMPDPNVAGSVEGTMDERWAATVSTLTKTRDAYEGLFAEVDERGDLSSASPAWELRDQIREALIDLAAVAAYVADDDVFL